MGKNPHSQKRPKNEEKKQAKIVLIYSHKNRSFLDDTTFLDFLEGMAEEEKASFWWDKRMSRTLWDEEIKRRLNEADVVVCLVSQPFIRSAYIKNVEVKITLERLINNGIIVVVVMLEACTWNQHDWLKKIHHLPEQGYIRPDHNHDRARTFREIADHIRYRIQGCVTPYREPRAIYTLRRLSDSTFLPEEKKILIQDAKRRAKKFVPDMELQRKICNEAKVLRRKNRDQPLSKAQLEDLDERFLACGSRKKDAKKVRWVLRANNLHPQGRAKK